ncbi:hypothetical protein [Floridanema aerugineum]|jgi:hypothetical protein|uniref:Type I restriction enzyme R protein N-terminal domain-containing protein n=1 Tax=Floridaenema aerugineum BLCC-F46 TaxID=3153654 RepID=A0ABV4X496_9CYAN
MIEDKKKKKNFASFNKKQAFKQLNLTDLMPWKIEAQPIQASDFFQKRLERLQRFDLEGYEESKKLLIDAICEEALEGCEKLKIWKGAALETDVTSGNVDYLIAERKRYLEAPFLCIVEAKKDDFEQGLAQCLVEMQACQIQNRKIGKEIDVFGIVTNGDGWRFYKLTPENTAYETLLYGIAHLDEVLGLVHYVFQLCQQNLD